MCLLYVEDVCGSTAAAAAERRGPTKKPTREGRNDEDESTIDGRHQRRDDDATQHLPVCLY